MPGRSVKNGTENFRNFRISGKKDNLERLTEIFEMTFRKFSVPFDFEPEFSEILVEWNAFKQCSVDPPSCVCCAFAITLHGVRIGMEHLKPPELLLPSAATKPKHGDPGKCLGISTKLRADSTKKRKRFRLPRCFMCYEKNVWRFFQILFGLPREIGIKLKP